MDESAVGKEARLYLAAKRHLSGVVAELTIAQENKANLPERPARVGTRNANYHTVNETIRQHDRLDEHIQNLKGERVAMATLVDTHWQQLRNQVYYNIEDRISKMWQDADIKEDTQKVNGS